MANLYELMGDFAALQDAIDAGASGEEVEALLVAMDEAKGTLKTKVDNVARVLRNIGGQVTAVQNEERRLAARRKALANSEKRLREWVRTSMDVLEVDKIKTDLNNVTLGKAQPTVVVLNGSEIPAEYTTTTTTTSVNKKRILTAYKEHGEIVKGTDIVPGKRTLTIR